jgi:hypothetical protein
MFDHAKSVPLVSFDWRNHAHLCNHDPLVITTLGARIRKCLSKIAHFGWPTSDDAARRLPQAISSRALALAVVTHYLPYGSDPLV